MKAGRQCACVQVYEAEGQVDGGQVSGQAKGGAGWAGSVFILPPLTTLSSARDVMWRKNLEERKARGKEMNG